MQEPKVCILAAGLSTRLPNKPILPIREGLAIESSLHFAGGRDTVVVYRDPIHRAILEYRGWNVDWKQYDALGFVGTIAKLHRDLPMHPLIILCCDSVWHPEEPFPDFQGFSAIRTQTFTDGRERHLDYYYGASFAGWLMLTSSDAAKAEGVERTSDFLHVIQPHTVSGQHDWWDIGTPETYTRYWNAH